LETAQHKRKSVDPPNPLAKNHDYLNVENKAVSGHSIM
jgi:hypothetical protein